jgi:hypothetical protein
MEDLITETLHNEFVLFRHGYILDSRSPWFTLIKGVSAIRIDAHSYPHALHQAVALIPGVFHNGPSAQRG